MENKQKAFYAALAVIALALLGAGARAAGAQGLAFGLFAVLTLGGALICLWERSVVRSAFALTGTFVGAAGFFLLLGADFLAMVQILLYVGGILALLLFGVMLTPPDPTERKLPRVLAALVFVAATFGWLAFKVAATARWASAPELPEMQQPRRGDRRRLHRPARLRRALRARRDPVDRGPGGGRLHRPAALERLQPAAGRGQLARRRGLMGLGAYLAVSACLFALGIACVISRRNVLYVLMGLEMIINAANINFVAFNRFNGDGLDGRMFAIFVIILAAAEAAIALAIILNVFHLFNSVKPSEADFLRE